VFLPNFPDPFRGSRFSFTQFLFERLAIEISRIRPFRSRRLWQRLNDSASLSSHSIYPLACVPTFPNFFALLHTSGPLPVPVSVCWFATQPSLAWFSHISPLVLTLDEFVEASSLSLRFGAVKKLNRPFPILDTARIVLQATGSSLSSPLNDAWSLVFVM